MTITSIYALTLLTVILSFSNIITITAQRPTQAKIDSLIAELSKAKLDTNKVNQLNRIRFDYRVLDPVKGGEYGAQAVALSNELNWLKGKAIAHANIGFNSFFKSGPEETIPQLLEGFNLAEQVPDTNTIGLASIALRLSYYDMRNLEPALKYDLIAIKIYKRLHHRFYPTTLYNVANNYNSLLRYPEALTFEIIINRFLFGFNSTANPIKV